MELLTSTFISSSSESEGKDFSFLGIGIGGRYVEDVGFGLDLSLVKSLFGLDTVFLFFLVGLELTSVSLLCEYLFISSSICLSIGGNFKSVASLNETALLRPFPSGFR